MAFRSCVIAVALGLLGTAGLSAQTKAGPPNLQGVWTNGTLTPLTRPTDFADRYALTKAEAAEFERTGFERVMKTVPELDRMTAGDLNDTYLDTAALKVVPDRRTSLIVDPPNGMLPPRTSAAQQRPARPLSYDDPESRTLHERCLLSFNFGGSSSVPPLVPNPVLQDFYRIVQTPQHVAILAEMFHDVRVIPVDGRARTNLPQWMGESRGHWEGDVLVVETSNFADKSNYWWATSWRASRPSMRMVERFRRIDAETLDYEFTMTDPTMFTRSWTAKFPLTTNQKARGVTEGPLYEYACHEGNYAIVNVLKGARAQEAGQGDGPSRR